MWLIDVLNQKLNFGKLFDFILLTTIVMNFYYQYFHSILTVISGILNFYR